MAARQRSGKFKNKDRGDTRALREDGRQHRFGRASISGEARPHNELFDNFRMCRLLYLNAYGRAHEQQQGWGDFDFSLYRVEPTEDAPLPTTAHVMYSYHHRDERRIELIEADWTRAFLVPFADLTASLLNCGVLVDPMSTLSKHIPELKYKTNLVEGHAWDYYPCRSAYHGNGGHVCFTVARSADGPKTMYFMRGVTS